MRSRFGVLGLLSVLLTTALVAAGCGSSSSSDTGSTAASGGSSTTDTEQVTDPSGSGVKIAFPVPGPAPYVDGYLKEWNRLAGEAGAETLQTMGDWTPETQASQIDALIAKHPDVFVIWAAENKAIVPVLARIESAGIPAIATNAYPDPTAFPYLKGYTGPNDILQGEIAAENLIKAVGSSGEVAMVRGTAGTAANTARAEGFETVLEKEAPEMKLVVDQNGDWGDVNKAYEIVSAALKQYPDLTGVFVQDDGMAPGAEKAAQDAGKEIQIVGIGGSCAAKKLIASGQLAATTVQDPWDDAAKAFEAATKVAAGESIPKVTYLEPPVVTKENVNSFQCHW